MWAIDTRHHKLKSARLAKGTKKTKRNADLHTAEDKQASLIRKKAQEIIDSGVLGKGEFMVSLSGHANKDFTSLTGEQNDMIMISIQKLAEDSV